MESSPQGRCGEIVSDMAIILVTAAQLIFLTSFHEYIAWPVTGPDGSVTRLSMLTDGYSSWLPFPVTASIVVIVASITMIVYHRYRFHQGAWVLFCLMGLAVVVSLLTLFPFDFSVIPNAAAVEVVPIVVTVFLILMAVFYGISALVLFMGLRRHLVKQGFR